MPLAQSKPHKATKAQKPVTIAKDSRKASTASQDVLAAPKNKRVVKLGRPTEYTSDIALEFCARIVEGRSLRSVCNDADMPSTRTVYNWFDKHPTFVQHYTRAKEDSADAYADEIQELADKVVKGTIPAKAGHVAIQAKMWTASKLKPKRYGERLDLTTDGEKLPAPNIYLPSELPYSSVLQVDSEVIDKPQQQIEQGH